MNYLGKFDAKHYADGGSDAHSGAHLHLDSISGHAPSGTIVVPDAQLLFTGDYKRSGVDLILSKDDRELVLQDYFKGEKRAVLASPDGAQLSGDLVNALTGHVEYAQAGGAADAAKIIGHVTKVTGSASALRNGVVITLNEGDNVAKGDVVQTGSDSQLGITFIDGTVFGLSSKARMVLNDMVYDPNGSNNSSLLSLVAGTISFIAGETAKHGDMKVNTPVATMGIRGTAPHADLPELFEIDFNVPAPGGPVKFQVLTERDGHTGSYILYSLTDPTVEIGRVNQAGLVTAVTGLGQITTAPAPPLSPAAIAIIGQVADQFFQNAQQPPNPNPQTHSPPPGSTPAIPPPPAKPGDTSPINGLPFGTPTTVPIPINLPAPTPNDPNAVKTVNIPVTITVLKAVNVTPVVDQTNFQIADHVTIADSQPADTLVPFVAGSGTIVSAVGPANAPANLASLVSINPQTGAVTYDPASFAFLKSGEKVTVTVGFDSKAGGDTFHETLVLTIDNTAPTPVIDLLETKVVGGVRHPIGIAGVSLSEAGNTSEENFTVTVTADHGILSAVQHNGAIATGTTLTISGSLSDVNAELATLTDTSFTPGSDTITLNATDGAGVSATQKTIEVTVNDRPVITTLAPVQTIGINQTTGISGVSLSESGNTDTSGETFTVTVSDFVSQLSVKQLGGSTVGVTTIGASGTSLTIQGSLIDVNKDLATLTDTNGTTGSELITLTAHDSFGNSLAEEQSISVQVNDVPSIIAPFSQTIGVSQPATISGVSLSEGGILDGETFTVVLSDANGKLSAVKTGTTDTVTASGTTLTIQGSLSDVNADLATLTDTNGTVRSDPITVTAIDSLGNNATSQTIKVAVNDVPVITVPGAQTIVTNESTKLSGVSLSENGNTDTSGETFTVTLSDSTGVLSAKQANGAIATGMTLTITGSLSDVNAELATLTDTNSSAGPDPITLTVVDSLGNTSTTTIDVTVDDPIHWTNSSGGDFAVASNWSSGFVPGAGDNAVIDAGGTYTVTSAINETVHELTTISGATLDITAGTFTLENGTGSGSNAGLIHVSGTLALNGGTFTGGTLVDNGFVESVASATLDGVKVTNSGKIDVDPTASGAILTLDDGTTVTGGTLTIGSSGALDITAGPQGAVGNGNPDATLDGVKVINSGTIDVDPTASGAILMLDDGTTVTGGALHIGVSGEVYVRNNGASFGATLDGVTVTNEGSLEIGGPTITGSTLALDGGTTISGGTLALLQTGDVVDVETKGHGSDPSKPDATLDGVKVNNTGTIEVGTTKAGTILALDDGTTVTGGTIADNGLIDITGDTTISGSTIDRPLAALPTYTWKVDGTSGDWSAAANWSAGIVPDANSNATIAGTETVTVSSNQSVNTLTLNDLNATLAITNNAGLFVFGGFTVSGAKEIDVGGQGAALIVGGDAATLDHTTLNLGTSNSVFGALTIRQGTALTLGPNLTLNAVGGEISDSGTVDNQGAISSTGTLTINPFGGFTNHGAIGTTGSGDTLDITLFGGFGSFNPLSGGAFTNATGGTISSIGNSDTLSIQVASFVNDGTVTFAAQGGSGGISAFRGFDNEGTIFVANGDVVTVDAFSARSGLGTDVNNGNISVGKVGSVGSGVHLSIFGDLEGHGSVAILDGGTLEISGTLSNNVSFADGVVGTLQLDIGGTLTGTLSGLALGDVIDFANATITDTNINADSNILTVTFAGGKTETIALNAPLPSGDSFQVQLDGQGGNELVVANGPLPPTPSYSWTAGTSGKWSTASNWSNDIVPDGKSNATIGGTSTETVTVSTNQSVNTLTLDDANATLAITNATLSVFGGVMVSAAKAIDVSSGALTIGGGAAVTLDNTTLDLSAGGSLTIAEGTALTLGPKLIVDVADGQISGVGSLDNKGMINGGRLVIDLFNGTFVNEATGTIKFAAQGDFGAISALRDFDNEGNIAVTNGDRVSLVVFSPSSSLSGSAVNNGTLSVGSGGHLSVFGDLEGHGSVAIHDGGALEISGTLGNAVSFADGVGTLQLDIGGALTGTLSGLALGDVIDFANATITGTAVNGNTLTVTFADGTTDAIVLAAPVASTSLQIQLDGQGGDELVVANGSPPPTPTYTWKVDGTNGDWSAASNWSNGIVPNGKSNATIGGTGTETVTVSNNQSVNMLTLSDPNATLAITNNATLSVFSELLVSPAAQAIDVTAGELLVGALNVGHFTLRDTTVVLGSHPLGFSSGTLGLAQGTALTLGSTLIVDAVSGQISGFGASLDNQGTISATGDHDSLNVSLTSFTNDGAGKISTTGAFDSVSIQTFSFTSNNAFANSSTISSTGGDDSLSFSGSGGFLNSGTITFAAKGGTGNIAETFDNEGNIVVANGDNVTLGISNPFGFAPPAVNNKIISVASGGSLTILGDLGGAGSIDILGGGTLIVSGATLSNAVNFADGVGTLVLDVANGAVFTGTLSGLAPGDIIDFGADITNSVVDGNELTVLLAGGKIETIALGGPLPDGDSLKIQRDGLGHSELVVVSGAPASVTIEASHTLTLDDVTVSGSTFVNTASGSVIQIDDGHTLTLSGAAINGGTINDGTSTGATIDVTGSSIIYDNASLNNGTVTIEAGRTLVLDSDTVTGTMFNDTAVGSMIRVDSGKTLLDGVTVNNVGGTIEAVGATAQVDLHNATIHGGTLQTSDGGVIDVVAVTTGFASTLDGATAGAVTIDGNVTLLSGSMLALEGTIDNHGTILVDQAQVASGATLQVSGDVTLNGGGIVTLAGINDTVAGVASSGDTLENVDNTISGFGDLGGHQLTLTNDSHGIIAATDGSNQLVIDTGSGIFTNHGTVLSNGAGGLEIKGDVATDGLLEASAGLLKVDGASVGPGAGDRVGHAVLDGGNIEFGGRSDAIVQFSGSTSDKLILDDVAHFQGSVTDFSFGDTIDLVGIDPANVHVSNTGSLHVDFGTGTFALVGNYDPAGFTVETDSNGGTNIVWNHQTPTIVTDQFSVAQNSDGTTTISGLKVLDADPAVSTETFTETATTAGAPGSSVSPSSSGPSSLNDLNAALSNVTYNPGATPPATDKVTLTVADSFGATNTVNFIFNEAGNSATTVLNGTAGKDVIFATGHQDTLTGGGGQDQFVFKPNNGPTVAQHTITDFVSGLDKIDVRQFGNIGSFSDLRETQHGNDTLITLDSSDTLLLKNVVATHLHASDFIVHT